MTDNFPNDYFIMSGIYDKKVLVAARGDKNVYLHDQEEGNSLQVWFLTGNGGKFQIQNSETKQYMTYPGGNGNPLVLVDQQPTGNEGFFSFGTEESWHARALRCYIDEGQNVDAGIDTPTTGVVKTRGWRNGHQRELTWILVDVK